MSDRKIDWKDSSKLIPEVEVTQEPDSELFRRVSSFARTYLMGVSFFTSFSANPFLVRAHVDNTSRLTLPGPSSPPLSVPGPSPPEQNVPDPSPPVPAPQDLPGFADMVLAENHKFHSSSDCPLGHKLCSKLQSRAGDEMPNGEEELTAMKDVLDYKHWKERQDVQS